MKIAIVHLDYSTYFVDRLLSFQKNIKETDSVYIIEVLGTSPLYPFMKVQKNNLNNYECLFPKSTYDNIEAKKIYKAVVERLNIINPDVVFSGPIAFPSSAAALFWAKKHNRGIVLFDDCHKDTFERSKLNTYVKIKLFENVDAFLCPSEDYLETMLDFGFTPDQIYYGLNVVNNEFWWNTESEYCSDFDNSYFITVGRQVPGKNLISLVKAYNK